MKNAIAVWILTLSLCIPAASWAQDSEDFGKSAVAQALLKRPQNNAPSRSIQAPQSSSPYELKEEVPPDVDQLMERVESQNGILVEEFESLIEKDPLNPDAPKWLSQIAEFHWQMAHYQYLRERRSWLEKLDSCADDDSTCPPEPKADYKNAVDDYRRLLAKYPTYENLDEVLFRLGDALIRNDQSREGISYLHRLTQSYPDYKDLDAAYLAMGEFYFSQKNTGTAQAAYQKIIDNYPNSAFYQYAQYKLAWTYLNLADEDSYIAAIDLFKKVVESIDSRYASAVDSEGQIDENKLKSGEISFRNQALNDLSTTYVELPEGWKQAREYLNTKLPPDKARDKIEQLGAILDAQGKFEEEIELYADLIEQNPLHPHVVDWRIARIEAFKASNRLLEAEEYTRQSLAALNPDSQWYKQNASENKTAIAHADKFASFQLYSLAMAAIEKAEKTNNQTEKDSAWADAEALLANIIQYYIQDESAFDIYYTYAYVLDERSDGALNALKKQYGKKLKSDPSPASEVLVKLKDAASSYQKIVDWPVDDKSSERDEQIRVAANRQVFVYANILATSDPDWSIVNSAKTTSFVEEKRGSEVREAEPLSKDELGFVKSAEQFSLRYPKDDETPAFLWRAAEIYRTHNNYNQAAQRFDQIVTNFPDHQYAAVAVGSMFELYYKANNYEKIEFWAKWLIAEKNFKHYTEKELQNTASFAIDKQAVALADDGKFDLAVDTIMRIEEAFPDRLEHTTAARQKAAAFHEANQKWFDAIQILNPLLVNADTPVHAAQAAYKIGVFASKIARFEQSANAFEDAANRYFALDTSTVVSTPEKSSKSSKKKTTKEPENNAPSSSLDDNSRLETAQSVLYAVQLLKSLDQKSRASALLDLYIKYNQNLQFDIYRLNNNIVLTPSDEDKSTAIPVLNLTAANLERAALEDNHENAMNRLASLYNDPKFSDEPLQIQRNVVFQWAQYAVDAKNNNEAKKALKLLTPDENSWSRTEMARYYYLQGRASQIDFENVVLEFPIRTLRKSIEQKAKLRQGAEKLFQQAISYKNAQISTAAAYELAQMALHFRDAFKTLPPPKELENDPDALDEYTVWIEDELIFPAEDAAASLLDIARQITVQLESYTPQAQKSSLALAELKPDIYPVKSSSVDIY